MSKNSARAGQGRDARGRKPGDVRTVPGGTKEKKERNGGIRLPKALAVMLLILTAVFAALFWGETEVAERAADKTLKERAESIGRSYVTSYEDSSSVTELYAGFMASKAEALALLVERSGRADEEYLASLCDVFDVDAIQVAEDWQQPEPELSVEYYSFVMNDGRTAAFRQYMFDEEELLEQANFNNALITRAGSKTFFVIYATPNGFIPLWSGVEEGDQVFRIGDLGIDQSDVEYGRGKWMTILGKRYYVYAYEKDDFKQVPLTVLCGIPYEEMAGSSRIAAASVCTVIALVLTVLVTYVFYSRQDELRYGGETDGSASPSSGRKIALFLLIGLILIGLGTYYVQTLFSLSAHVLETQREKESVVSNLRQSQTRADRITEICDRQYLTIARIVSRILSDVPQMRTREGLARLSGLFGLESIMLFDGQGRETLSDSPVFGFELSGDPKSQFYPFRVLMNGVPHYVQEARQDELTGQVRKYVGATMTDADGAYDGFLLICASVNAVERLTDSVSFESILTNEVSQSEHGVLAADRNSGSTVLYSRNPDLTGQSVFSFGMSEDQFRSGYLGYLRLNGESLFADSFEAGDRYVYIVAPGRMLFSGRSVMTAFALLLSLAAVLAFRLWFRSREVAVPDVSAEADPYVAVSSADGSKKRTLNIVSRVFRLPSDWRNKPSEEKTRDIVRSILLGAGLLFALTLAARNRLYDEMSFLGFLTGNRWNKGLNIFALTKSLFFIFNVYLLLSVLEYVLSRFIALSNPRNETIIRLLKSLLRYVAVLGTLYYVLNQFGFDSRSLLASAGLLTLIVGLGARDLVTDILAGIFIIFENEFQVGDIIEVNGYKGQVVEIGIRTTKIINTKQDVKSVNNRNLTNVVNKTRKASNCDVIVNVPFDQDIDEIERVLNENLPRLRENCPHIIDGPSYGGIDDMSGHSMRLSIRAECAEPYKFEVRTLINREIKRLFDENGFRMV